MKLRGLRIEFGEIETVLAEQPNVSNAAVLVRKDGPTEQLVAYVVGGAQTNVLRSALLERLPEYMVPDVIVTLDEMPLNASGKLDRKALPAPVVESKAFRLPFTDSQRAVADVFSELLGVARVGLDDDFFALGGDSIVSIQLVARLKARGVVVSARDVFERRTVVDIASVAGDVEAVVVEELPGGGIGQIEPIPPVVSWMIERGGSGARGATQERGSFGRFHQLTVAELPADITREQVVATLTAVVDKHDALRSRLGRRIRANGRSKSALLVQSMSTHCWRM